MLAIKLKLDIDQSTKKRIVLYQQQYSNLLHIYFNNIKKGLLLKDFRQINYNNCQLITSYFKDSCYNEAKSLLKRNSKIIFGGKQNFFNRLKGLITKDLYKQNRLNPLCAIGVANLHGNLKFQILNNLTILFKPSKNEHINLKIKCNSKSYRRYLLLLIQHQLLKDIPITYKLTSLYISIIFDLKILQSEYEQYKKILNRIISIDMNPNYIGWSIIDWKNGLLFKLIDRGVLSIKNINDYSNQLNFSSNNSLRLYVNNKRQFETLQCSKFLIDKMIYYKCSLFTIEDLNIDIRDHLKGRWFNRLVNNNWNRIKLFNNLLKWCSIYNIQLLKIKPLYSSFNGNIVYRYLKLPDMILASILISRRGFEFYHQYIKQDKNRVKNIIHPIISNNVRSLITLSLEELGVKDIIWKDLFELYYKLKKSKCKYRFPLLINKESFSQKQLKYYLINSF